MLKVKTGLRVGKFLLGFFLVAGLTGPAFAGNVYSWVTEDGTYAFTDDSKRIPAKHRAEARKRTMGKLTRYERFTEVSSESKAPYAERIRARRLELREMAASALQGAAVGAVQSQSSGLVYTIPGGGGNGRRGGSRGVSMLFSVGDQASADSELTTIESIRVKPSHSLASRHWTIVKRGDRIVTVIKGEPRQRSLRSTPESDFDL